MGKVRTILRRFLLLLKLIGLVSLLTTTTTTSVLNSLWSLEVHVLSCVFFLLNFCFLLLFSVSTVYHFASEPGVKRIFKIFDHIGIYYFIAGTYTPFLLVYMHNSFGTTLLIILWALTVAGTVFKAWFTGKYEIISTLIYLAMGWIMVVGGRKFFDELPHEVLVFICIGAALYTVGVFFYLWDKYTYTHAVWHGFVLTAALCHYVAVLMAM